MDGQLARPQPVRHMPSTTADKEKVAKFDPFAGSTVEAGITNAIVPDATHYMKELAYVSIMTPMGDPFDEQCIWGAPLCFWGLPAVAKSDKIEQAAAEACLEHDTIYPSQRQPEDFSGVLFPSLSGEPTLECLLGAVRRLNKLGRGVIFLDEIGDASPVTQAAMLGFIRKRISGDVRLAAGIRMLCAANPPEHSTSGFTMKATTANRMGHFQVKCPPKRDWINHMTRSGFKPVFDAARTEDNIRAAWLSKYSHILAQFTGYMEHRGVTLHQQPPKHSAQLGFNWASPRTWELAARMRAAAVCLGQPDIILDLIVEGFVGEGCATDFLSWMREADLPRPEDVLAPNSKWAPELRRMDVAYAVLTSITQFILGIRDKKEALEWAVGAWKLYPKYVALNMGDLIVTSSRTLVDKGYTRSTNVALREAADPVMRWMGDNDIIKHIDT